jgi:hypothetical protein
MAPHQQKPLSKPPGAKANGSQKLREVKRNCFFLDQRGKSDNPDG